jgi:hypothetical protein
VGVLRDRSRAGRVPHWG